MPHEIQKKPTSLSKVIATGSITFSIAGLIQQFLLFAQSIITYRLLTVEQRGEYDIIWSIFALAGTFTFTKMFSQIVIKKVAANKDNSQKINQTVTGYIVYAVGTSVLFVFFFLVCFILDRLKIMRIIPYTLPLFIVSIVVFYSIVEYNFLLVGLGKYFSYNLIQILSAIIHFVLCVGSLIFSSFSHLFLPIMVFY
ncbi:MAG: hypothetical protein JW776_11140 [Candidatus Lokiarchaeota archaeon]|nr:hypothetical protein [Candidatus Lokiarchaeota archaeon]